VTTHGGWTRAQALRAAVAGGAVLAGGAALGGRGSVAAQAPEDDADILAVFLVLEQVQAAFYRQAIDRGGLRDELLEFARTVVGQEEQHASFLSERVGGRARDRPETDFADALSSPERFRDAAVELEEASLAAYVGQGANLSRDTVVDVATLVSVEARQAAWVRDLSGISPAPRAADPAKPPETVLTELRDRGYIA